MRVYPQINHALLGKAAGLSDQNLQAKFPYLQDWINGDKKPTVNQLASFAKAVHIPFGHFFLDQLPVRQNTVPLFRTNSKVPHYDYSYELSQTIFDIQRRQDWLVEYLQSEQRDPLPFVGRFSEQSNPKNIAADIRKEINLPANWSQFLTDKEAALKYLISAVEGVGI